MPFEKVNGINIYYEIHGPEKADVIVLSNGIFMSSSSWGYQVADLKSTSGCWCTTAAGCGNPITLRDPTRWTSM